MKKNNTREYYQQVGGYFDLFAEKHHHKSEENSILTEMRHSFRTFVTHPHPKTILDIGCGPGIDVAYFAQKFPDAAVYGIDVSAKMIEQAKELCTAQNLQNAQFLHTGIEKLQEHLDAEMKFDVITVFFGALNTVHSLEAAAQILDKLLNKNGQAMLSFVNKYYLSEFFINILKLRPKKAIARWGKVWGGYSNDFKLHSQTYTPAQIKKAFANTNLTLQTKKGYSVFYPAWFQQDRVKKYPRFCGLLARMDGWANKTFLWSKGEYTLFLYQKSEV